MTGRKTLTGWAAAGVSFLVLVYFSENAASFFEESGLNRNWTLIAPALRLLASVIRLLAHPVMTHVYAFLGGVAACAVIIQLKARANESQPNEDRLISMKDMVIYLREESAWAREKGGISDQELRFALIDAFAHGFVRVFARPREDMGVIYTDGQGRDENPSPLTQINSQYFSSVIIDLDAVRNDGPRQITLKPGHFGDQFDHWQFLQSDVHKLWPPFHEPKDKTKRGRK